ncbi:3-carboxy-cis,cis-muconate cycloisomerase, partial [Streptomyces sp. NPDC007110]
MTSAASGDSGLLAPGWTGSDAARATGDAAFLQALLDAEAALARAPLVGEHQLQARLVQAQAHLGGAVELR